MNKLQNMNRLPYIDELKEFVLNIKLLCAFNGQKSIFANIYFSEIFEFYTFGTIDFRQELYSFNLEYYNFGKDKNGYFIKTFKYDYRNRRKNCKIFYVKDVYQLPGYNCECGTYCISNKLNLHRTTLKHKMLMYILGQSTPRFKSRSPWFFNKLDHMNRIRNSLISFASFMYREIKSSRNNDECKNRCKERLIEIGLPPNGFNFTTTTSKSEM